jgi:hypothetical protein
MWPHTTYVPNYDITANTNSGGNQLETDSLLGGGGASGPRQNFSSRLKRVVDEMKDILIRLPAMASCGAFEVVRLLKSLKALELETITNLVVNVDRLRTETEKFNCNGFEYMQDEEGKPFILCPLCYKSVSVGSCAKYNCMQHFRSLKQSARQHRLGGPYKCELVLAAEEKDRSQRHRNTGPTLGRLALQTIREGSSHVQLKGKVFDCHLYGVGQGSWITLGYS